MKPLSEIRKENRELADDTPLARVAVLRTLNVAESRLLSAVKEKIEGMDIVVLHNEDYAQGFHAALSDLKSFIEEGMNTK